jgi:manganese/zinc/iron transport system permease protein
MGVIADQLAAIFPLTYSEAIVAMGAAILGIAAGMLGALAVLQGRSLVGDALAHSALPGVAIAFIVTGAKDPATLLAGAVIAGLLGAFMMVGIERTSRIRPDAAIGVVLSSFFALGIVLLTYVSNTGGAQQAGLDTYLFGQAAGIVERDVEIMTLMAAGAAILVVSGFRVFKTVLFDRGFAASLGLPVRVVELATTALLVVAIVIGLRTVGAILMVALLITPTVVARQFTSRLSRLLPLAALVGATVGVTGALASSKAEVPTGPVIVLFGVALAIAAILFAPGRGVAWRAITLTRARRRENAQGVLVALETAMHHGAPPTRKELALASGRSSSSIRRGLRDLTRAGLVQKDEGRVILNERGAAAAHAALESRRLWSAWLEHGWQLDLPDAREADPRDLRASLGDDAVERLLALERQPT